MGAEDPIRRQVVLAHENGLHLRPIKSLVQLTANFGCDVTIMFDDKVASAKSMLELMSLACTKGSELTVEAAGEGAEEAVIAVANVLSTDFE